MSAGRQCGTCRFWERLLCAGQASDKGRCTFYAGRPVPWWHVGTAAITWEDARQGENCATWEPRP